MRALVLSVALCGTVASGIALPAQALPTSRTAETVATDDADFNGDGRADIVTVGSNETHAGEQLLVEYGGKGWASYGAPPTSPQVGFAGSMATCDVNADSYTDLIVGLYFSLEGRASQRVDLEQGSIGIYLGGASGLRAPQLLKASSPEVPGSRRHDLFGSSIACGRVDRDIYADILIGSFGYSIPGAIQSGAAVLVHGSASGYSPSGMRLITVESRGVPGDSEFGDFVWRQGRHRRSHRRRLRRPHHPRQR